MLDCPRISWGAFYDEVSLSALYSACDVYVLPTLQEALGKTLMEALACGRPCVAFEGTGPDDMLGHRLDGYLACMKDSADLAAGIEWTLAQAWSRAGTAPADRGEIRRPTHQRALCPIV